MILRMGLFLILVILRYSQINNTEINYINNDKKQCTRSCKDKNGRCEIEFKALSLNKRKPLFYDVLPANLCID